MAGNLTVIWWRDIPAQVLARSGATTHKVVLHQRFQVAIDRAADVAGKNDTDAYLGEWHRESRPCTDDLVAEAAAEAASLEARYTRDALQRLIDAGGVAERGGAPPEGVPPAAPADPPAGPEGQGT